MADVIIAIAGGATVAIVITAAITASILVSIPAYMVFTATGRIVIIVAGIATATIGKVQLIAG